MSGKRVWPIQACPTIETSLAHRRLGALQIRVAALCTLSPTPNAYKSSIDHIEADAPQIAERRGADTAVLESCERLVCSASGSHNVDMVVTGTERR
jgi:hypothetical protein